MEITFFAPVFLLFYLTLSNSQTTLPATPMSGSRCWAHQIGRLAPPGGGTQTGEADGAVFQILYWKGYENLIFLSDSCNIRCRLGWQKYYLSVAIYMDKKTASPFWQLQNPHIHHHPPPPSIPPHAALTPVWMRPACLGWRPSYPRSTQQTIAFLRNSAQPVMSLS